MALDGSNGFRLDGLTRSASGQSVSSAGDVNGDGFGDVIIGAPQADADEPYSGSAYVLFGKAAGFVASLSLSALDGENGFRLDGAAFGDRTGNSVSSAGDVNGDGFDDLIIGAYGTDRHGSYSGSAYVVFGKADGFAASLSLSALDGENGFRLDGVGLQTVAGSRVSSAGDVNGDGFSDLMVGAPGANPNGYGSGSAFVIFGRAGGFAASLDLDYHLLESGSGLRLDGAAMWNFAGSSVSAGSDLDGDGFDDVVVGAPDAGSNGDASGSAYVVFGSNFTGEVTFLGTAAGETLAGTAAAERFVAGEGDDMLIGGGGADVLYGGAGDDVIRLKTELPFRVDGGSGTDVLDLSAITTPIDLTVLADNRLAGIEVFDLGGAGADRLTLAQRDVFALPDHRQPVTINGDDDDAVTLIGAWQATGSSAGYATFALGQAELRIDENITTELLLA
jgi:hypothetical protein